MLLNPLLNTTTNNTTNNTIHNFSHNITCDDTIYDYIDEDSHIPESVWFHAQPTGYSRDTPSNLSDIFGEKCNFHSALSLEHDVMRKESQNRVSDSQDLKDLRNQLNVAMEENVVDDKAVDEILRNLRRSYLEPTKTLDDSKLEKHIYAAWNLTQLKTSGHLELADIQAAYYRHIDIIINIQVTLLKHKAICNFGVQDHKQKERNGILAKTYEIIYYWYMFIIGKHCAKKAAASDKIEPLDELNLNVFRYNPVEPDKKKKPQSILIAFLLEIIVQNGYGLYRERICKQVTTKRGYNTRFWTEVMTVEEFINNTITKEMYPEIYDIFINYGSVVSLSKHLITKPEAELPRVVPDRHVFAFEDGIYDAKHVRFYRYESTIPSKLTSIKYFPVFFNPGKLLNYNNENWHQLQVDVFDNIFINQSIPELAQRQFMGFIGRLLYTLNELDAWQVLPFVKGVAQSGKSTLLKIVSYFYPTSDVGILMSNVEEKFGIYPIHNKLVFLCYEVKRNWSLDQGSFQSMITGEEMSVAIKHDMAKVIMWNVPGLMAGNELAQSWVDAAGSLKRRLVIVEFRKKIEDDKLNSNLINDLRTQIPAIIHKCNMAYHSMVQQCGSRGIWSILDGYYKATQEKLGCATNPLQAFLESGEKMRIVSKNALPQDRISTKIPLSVFREKYYEYCIATNRPRVFDEDSYSDIFALKDIKVGTNRETDYYKGKNFKDQIWIYGVEEIDVGRTVDDHNSLKFNG